MAPIWKPQTNETHKHWLTVILNESTNKLTDWENNFIDSIHDRIIAGQTLSQKQEEILDRIYTEKT